MTPSPRPGFLARLLGPAEPELGCDECFARLDEYVDAQARGDDAARLMPAMAAHLHGCPTCREEWDSLRSYLA